MAKLTNREARLRRHLRVRSHISGSAEKPRLSVFRSSCHIYAQVIDDVKRHTLAAASSLDPGLKGQLEGKNKTETAGLVGAAVAQRAQEQGVSQVVFDRGGYQYHGRVKALAEAAREKGLKF